MTKTNLKEIEKLAKKHTEESIKKELKRIQSVKCRLKKQKFKKSYEEEMTEVLKAEQVLKEVRSLIIPKKKFVTEFEKEDIEKLDYDEIQKAIKSIQSKKTLTRYLKENEEDNDEYQNAVRIEKMLVERREKIKPVSENHLRKTEVETIIETIESSGKLSQEKILELLKNLTK